MMALLFAGLLISLLFLVLQMHCRPYYTEELNMVQAASLLINVFTLFVGIMLILDNYLEAAAMQAGETYDQSGRTAVSIILFLANLLVILVPLVIFWSSSGVSIASTARPDATQPPSNPTSSSAYTWLCFYLNGAPGRQQEQPASDLHPAAIAYEQPILSLDQSARDAPGPSLEGDTSPDVIGDAQPISSSDQSGQDAPGPSLEGDTSPGVIGDAQPISSSDQSGQDAPGLSLEGDTSPDVIGDAQPISSSDQSGQDAPGPSLEGDTSPDVIGDAQPISSSDQSGQDAPGPSLEGDTSPDVIGDAQPISSSDQSGQDAPGPSLEGDTSPDVIGDAQPISSSDQSGQDAPGLSLEGDTSPDVIGDAQPISSSDQSGQDAPGLSLEGDTSPGVIGDAQPISSSDQSGRDAPGPSLEGDTSPDVHPDSEVGEGLKGCQLKTSNGEFLLSATLPERDGSKMEISNCESFRACPAPATLLEIQGSEAKENADGCNKQSQKDLDAVASAGILGCCEYYESDVILAAPARSSNNDDLGGGVVAPTGARTKHDQAGGEMDSDWADHGTTLG
jgi:hypothetical protein